MESAQELRKLDLKRLEEKLPEMEQALSKLRRRHHAEVLKNPMQIKQTRRSIARIQTILLQKKRNQA